MLPEARQEAIWWKGVDISRVQHKCKDPVPGPPRRVPDWGSVAQFFACAEETAAVKLESRSNSAKRQPMHGNNCVRSPTKRGTKREPRARPFQKSNPNERQRPCSAPALLRNEGFIAREPSHKDPFRQRVEDIAVRRSLGWMQREGQRKKNEIDRVDVLSDSCLFDLKVMHNSAQRAKGSKLRMESTPPERGKGKAAIHKQKTAADHLRDLCSEFDTQLDHESMSHPQTGPEETNFAGLGAILLSPGRGRDVQHSPFPWNR
eukprot:TRINITY_DN60474_c0_g1_i1.p1 TRINITY_DN60474_c0_g1~~TRINITY_DN60474_c0_g1_i1.p1  ORF type:complete len:282 (-),score=23.67 TRINITY_DN60474_c0_g1_i1:7-789(-)